MKYQASKSQTKAPKKQAAALKYSAQDNAAPIVLAKGDNALAEEISALAHAHGVLIHEDPHLAEILNTLDIGQEVPQEIFVIVAEIIAFSYVLQGKYPANWQGIQPINTEA